VALPNRKSLVGAQIDPASAQVYHDAAKCAHVKGSARRRLVMAIADRAAQKDEEHEPNTIRNGASSWGLAGIRRLDVRR
jgi:hypothetical protein